MTAHRLLRIIEGMLLSGIAAGLIGLLLIRLDCIRSTSGLGFLFIIGIVLLSNLFWWFWVYRILTLRKARADSIGWMKRLLSLLWTGYSLLLLMPFALIMSGARERWDALPVPALSWAMIWHLLIAGLGSLASAVFVMRIMAGCLRRRRSRAGETTSQRIFDGTSDAAARPLEGTALNADSFDPSGGLSRRTVLLRATAAAPLMVTGASLLAGLRQEGRFRLREIDMKVSGLPERLKGLTLTHLSDFHVGRFFRPEHLSRVVDTVNRLDSDIIAITGDIIDHSNDFLPAVQAAMARMESRHGRYLVIGNHDLFDEPRSVVEFLSGTEPNFLNDRLVTINVGGEPLQIAGLFWSRYDTRIGYHSGHAERVQAAMEKARAGTFTIGLAHHPHAFDAFANAGVHLVLAGHTHGGQIMLTPAGARPALGAGNLLFRYIHGEYAIGESRMYVNAGIGNWFPVRVNAPAEIVKIRLV